MKSQKTNQKIWLGAAIGFLMLMWFVQPQRVSAQQWATNGNNINNTNTGNVGIGTSSPTANLHIFGELTPWLQIQAGQPGDVSLFLQAARGADGRLGTNSPYPFRFFTNNVERMIIGTSGNIGIGTSSPGAILDVVGGIYNSGIRITSSSVSGSGLTIKSTAPGGHEFNILATASNITGGPGGLHIFDATANAARMRISPDGNVGIGTLAPLYKLDVNGEINATGLRINGTPISTGGTGGAVNSVFGRTGAVVAAPNDYTWAQINKTTSSLADLTTRSAGDLSSGTLPDARFPATLPAVSGVNLTALNASNLATGTVPITRLGASGTAGATTFLRGDNTWAVPSGNGNSQWITTSGTTNISYNTGNVGIGTNSPAYLLDVAGSTNTPFRVRDSSGREYFSTTTRTGTFGTVQVVSLAGNRLIIDNSGPDGGNDTILRRAVNSLVFNPSDTPSLPGAFIVRQVGGSHILFVDQNANGNVGIGTSTPSKKLDVSGDINATGTITGGNIVAKYQDVAEWVPASELIPIGTVVVLDSTKSNHVIASTQTYDTRVAGVISEKPGLVLGERGDNKVLVATTGRVRIKVDATRGPIHIGDLLVTSDVPGLAMKSEPVNIGGVQIHRPGTLIGKALEPLAKGQGEILILLSLQ